VFTVDSGMHVIADCWISCSRDGEKENPEHRPQLYISISKQMEPKTHPC
jgi:hypothetical protein